jgi:hypothetical protein
MRSFDPAKPAEVYDELNGEWFEWKLYRGAPTSMTSVKHRGGVVPCSRGGGLSRLMDRSGRSIVVGGALAVVCPLSY